MKKWILAIALCLCAASAVAWMGPMMGGGVDSGAAGCTTLNDSLLVAFAEEPGTNNYPVSDTTWRAQIFRSGSGWTLTEYSLYLYDDGNGTATFTASLYTTDGSHYPDSEVSDTAATVTGVANSWGEYQLTLPSPKTGLSATTEYAVVLRCSNSNGSWKRAADGSGIANGYIAESSDSGANWSGLYSNFAMVGDGVFGCE